MRYSLTAAALVAAMTIGEVAARPSLKHRHIHTKKDLKDVDWSNVDYDFSGVDWKTVDYSNGAHAPATSTPAPVAAPALNLVGDIVGDVADAVDDVVDDIKSSAGDVSAGLWHGLVGAANDLTAFGKALGGSGRLGDFYSGEVGSPYGSNMIKVDAVGDHDHTNNFINTSGEKMTVVIWNKVGRDGQVLSGSTSATVDPSLTFVLGPGENQIVAFLPNTQYGFAQATDSLLPSGQFDTSFGECNTVAGGPTCNLSAIPNSKGNTYDLTISNAQNDCVSSPQENCWITPTVTLPGLDGIARDGSCYIMGQKGTFTSKLGGQH